MDRRDFLQTAALAGHSPAPGRLMPGEGSALLSNRADEPIFQTRRAAKQRGTGSKPKEKLP